MSNWADPPLPKTSVSFFLNGEQVTVKDASTQLTLNEWLRIQPGVGGTKRMCGEGGCGCCVVAAATSSMVEVRDDGSWDCLVVVQQDSTIAINSCLCPLYAIEGWYITTVEGIGSSTQGFHPIQLALSDYNGTQCGYCSPGFVMSMYSLLQSNSNPTKQEVEDNFDGNICRCTGYRSILDSMKSFASDSEEILFDIEELDVRICPKTNQVCRQDHTLCNGYKMTESDPAWYSPTSLDQLTALFAANPKSTFRFIAGNTGKGVYKDTSPVNMLISLMNISELQKIQVGDSSLIVGSAVSLKKLIDLLQTNTNKSPNFLPFAKHIQKVANVPVRNIGTWAGNLMLAHDHKDFPSDLLLLLAASQANLTIGSISSSSMGTKTCSPWDLLTLDMSQSFILSVEIPFLPETVTFSSYKIMPRAENTLACASAAFAMEVNSTDNFTVTGDPVLVVGGGSTHPMPCPQTAQFLKGKSLLDANTLKGALDSLTSELNASPSADNSYKMNAVLGLLYKFYLECIPGHVSPQVKSASSMLVRPLSHGSQIFTPQTSEPPVGLPIKKLEARLQASGEAEYTTDIPLFPNELAAAFVLTTKSNVEILNIDTSIAEQMPGFVRVLTANDIPSGGTNNVVSHYDEMAEVLFADYRSEYTGQAVALVLADTQQNAQLIAKAVSVEYGDPDGPLILETQDAVRDNSFFSFGQENVTSGDPRNALAKSEMHLEGQIECGSQYHFTLETQTALVVPKEDGYIVYSSTQWVSYVQTAVAHVLGIPVSSVDVIVKRVGGAYGCKITRANIIAAGCAVGAQATKRPVRMHMDLESNMKLIGKRFPFLATYQVGFSKEGIVDVIIVNIFGNSGINPSTSNNGAIPQHIDNAYHVANWEINVKACKTNLAANTACRSPGTLPAIFIMESIMDHVARTLGMDVDEVKKQNLYQQDQYTPTGIQLKYCQIRTLWDQLYQSADVESRKAEIASFNKANRWIKRGISMVPIKFQLDLSGVYYNVFVSIYAEDGTVALSHGGVEIGQGVNTKAVQVAAKMFDIPMERIKVKPCSTVTNPNGFPTGGSITSELICLGTINACKMLNDRIKPIRDKNPDLSWDSLIQTCYNQSVDLSAKFCVTHGDKGDLYYSYGVGVTEVELDVLTGFVQIPRVDLLYDCGESINPGIDIGQVEGAFVMGLGYWLTEEISFDADSGELTTCNTWTYRPPSSKDIPIDFRVELLKNAPNPIGILGSKAVGEPPMCMSCSSLFAVKRAIEEARKDIGKTDFFPLSGPATIEKIHDACLVDHSSFTI